MRTGENMRSRLTAAERRAAQKECHREWQLAHKKEVKEYCRKYYLAHKDKCKSQAVAYQKAHIENSRKATNKSYRAHAEARKEHARKRWAEGQQERKTKIAESYIALAEYAKLCGIDTNTARYMVHSHKLNAVKIGGLLYVPRDNPVQTRMKVCVICGKEFLVAGARNTCSEECRKKQQQKWRHDAYLRSKNRPTGD
jgi:hypothetical protein